MNAVPVNVRLPPDLLAKLDEWIGAQPSPPTRAEVIRVMVAASLESKAMRAMVAAALDGKRKA